MSHSPPPESSRPNLSVAATPGKIGRCFFGAVFAGGLGVLMYRMTMAIAATFAHKPVTSDNVTVINISAAVRTLVVGIVALGAGIFAIAALGLLLLGIQLIFIRLTQQQTSRDQA
ncbi:DUF3082 domain-containing protein [filamentous cyanobacterium CCP5]|nr:DUF3082 domain-containing protein [filamentous cyanobacterium CCP5]